jgi:ribosome-associated heat shock protein Hsp15
MRTTFVPQAPGSSKRFNGVVGSAGQDEGSEQTRVDRWLWSVRVFKTRSMATEAVRAGHVSVNRGVTKPATTVRAGDVVTIRLDGRDRVLEVARVIDRRVGAAIAAECVVDHSPPPPPREFVAPALMRDPATGRPTKRDRRQIDRLRQR